ncbi:hypothetical protein H5410_022850, partial [Solanum commersonii]
MDKMRKAKLRWFEHITRICIDASMRRRGSVHTIFSLQNRFEPIEAYGNIFDFLFSGKILRSLDDENLKKYCLNLELSLTRNSYFDIDGSNLFFELK